MRRTEKTMSRADELWNEYTETSDVDPDTSLVLKLRDYAKELESRNEGLEARVYCADNTGAMGVLREIVDGERANQRALQAMVRELKRDASEREAAYQESRDHNWQLSEELRAATEHTAELQQRISELELERDG